MPWHPYRAARLRLYLQYGSPNLFGGLTCSRLISFAYLTCGRLIKLGLAYIFCFIIRNRRYVYYVFSGFTRGEYHVIRVDLIVALRRTKGRRRRTLRSPSPPSSGLHLLTPGLSAAAGHIGCRGLCQYRIPVSGAGRLSPVPNFVQLSVFGLVSFAFQSGCWAGIVRFSLLGGWTVCACGYVGGMAIFFRGICADRDWIVCLDW